MDLGKLGALLRKRHDGRSLSAEPAARFESFHKLSFAQNVSYDLALHADSLAVNYPHDLESLFPGSREVRDSDRLNVFGRKSMKVDRVCDLDLERLGVWIVGLFVGNSW